MRRLSTSFVFALSAAAVLTACGEATLDPIDTHGASDVRDTSVERDTEAPDVAPETVEVDAAQDAEPEFIEPTPLVDSTLWVRVPDAEDPFFSQRPAGLLCDEAGILQEAGTLEIKTELCNWPTLEQPLMADVAASDTLEVIFFFGPLLGEAGEALVEMHMGGEMLWQKTFAIPSTGGFIIQNVTPPRAFSAGEQVLFHLHNHGANTWNLASVSILGSE